MGIYFNPGNESFTKDKNSELYLDKTGLLEYLNRVVGTNANCISVSHARRFGKSHAAGMIDAYYSRGCDSSDLFKDTEIATKNSYKKYLNQYNVIHIDVSSFWDVYKENIIEKIQEYIYDELERVYGSQLDYTKMISSALNNFREYTMLKSKQITRYFGFTEEEVKNLCDIYHMDFESVKAWYNGYLIDGLHMYNPNSVVQAMLDHDFDYYWKNTSSFESINTFITMNYEGLKDDVLAMLAGEKVRVNVNTFQNDLTTVASKDDALTALIHLGYLGYDADKKSAYVPNYEVAAAFELALQTGAWSEVAKSISKCDELLDATLDGDADKVAELVELAHETYTPIIKYNDENSLSCVLTMAYFTASAYYNIVREFSSGKGYADLVFIPRANAGTRPAMIVELKYNKSADSAIQQIKERRYQGALSGYGDKILLVGINYSDDAKKLKKHTCIIEEIKSCD